MSRAVRIPEALKGLFQEVQEPVSAQTLDALDRITEIRDRSFRMRTIVTAWEHQQENDRSMRKTYATWLLIVVSLQMLIINAAFFFIGFRQIVVEEWVANTFIIGVFAEVSSLALIVVKYLFPDTSKTVVDLLDRLSEGPRQ